MPSSDLRSEILNHTRSASLPSTSHPIIPQFNEHLCTLRDTSSLPLVSNKLKGLEHLYNCVQDLLLLPRTQQAFTQECNEKWFDEALDGYVMLLDVCGSTKDILSQTKQDVQELLSVLRRRRDSDDLERFLISRRKAKKVIQRSLKDLRRTRRKNTVLPLEAVSMLKEVEAVTLAVFESLLSYVYGTKVEAVTLARLSSWSLVFKLNHHKNVGCRDKLTDQTNEFDKLETALQSSVLLSNNKKQVENLQNQLVKLEPIILEFEEGLECLFRRLIKTRVSLLNFVDH